MGSTQKWVRDHMAKLPSPTLVIADEQTAGHGQFDRKWASPPGDLYLSLYFCLPPGARGIERLAQEVACAAAGCLSQRGYAVEIRWPNDLMIEGKKVGGVLCEVISDKEAIHVIAGVGINIVMEQELLERIDQPATALKWCKGNLPTRDELAQEFRALLDLGRR